MAVGGEHCVGEEAEMIESSSGKELVVYEGDENIEPYKGMEFESEEAAKVYYDMYATRIGFIMRVDAFRRSLRDGSVICRRLVCNKEGFRKAKPKTSESRKVRAITREGCKAMLMVKREKTGKWMVSKFIKEHNHPLVVSSGNSRRSLLLSYTPVAPSLEDVAALLQLEIFGEHVIAAINYNDPVMMECTEALTSALKASTKKSMKRANFNDWVRYFWREQASKKKGVGTSQPSAYGAGMHSPFRREAFIAVWLSRYIFPAYPYEKIQERLFGCASRIANGTRYSLVSLFLGNLYHNLDLFHRDLVKSKGESPIEIFACASFLQMWLWERVPGYAPSPSSLVQLAINKGTPEKLFPRALRWSNVRPKKNAKLFHSLDKGFFNFRPYTQTLEGALPLDYYTPGTSFQQVDFPGHITAQDLNFFAIITYSVLVVINESPFISVSYNPSRFQRQFGLDQGVPLLSVHAYPPPAAGRMHLVSRWREYLSPALDSFLLPQADREGRYTPAMKEYWARSITYFQDFINSPSLEVLPEEPSPRLKGQKKAGKRTLKKTTVGGLKRKLVPASKKAAPPAKRSKKEETEAIYISESEWDNDSSPSIGEELEESRGSFFMRPRKKAPSTPVHVGSEAREEAPRTPIHDITCISAFFDGIPSYSINGVLRNDPELHGGAEVIGQPSCIPMDSLSGIVGENITGFEEDMAILRNEFGDLKESTQVVPSTSNPPLVTVSSPPFQSNVPVPLPSVPLIVAPQIPPIDSSPLIASCFLPSRPLPVHQSSTLAVVQGSEWSLATPLATTLIGDYKVKPELEPFADLRHWRTILEDAHAIGVEIEWLLVRLDELSIAQEFQGRVKQAEVELRAAQAKLYSLEEEQQILAKNHEELEEVIVMEQDKLKPLREEGKALEHFIVGGLLQDLFAKK
ncbi:hypothetical protein HHK36_020077 [Tetracentron sinense]|uniref:Uncharacterized protein n=1 Tax=Tetracentron sinense TaxID=13715 RepID=A0A834YQZ9_TETSI|nr:hypothetical protein HHK36_020077 [Tetracentron sinense]